MRKAILSLVVFVVLVGLCSTAAMAQTSNVTFMINTATVPDTIVASSSVTVTGSKPAITDWGAGTAATNIGGDYWSTTVAFTQGDTVYYKFRVDGAWENNTTLGSTNRELIVGTSDTTLPMQYVNFTGGNADQYRTPWTAVADTFINIWFRVNMQALSSGFDPNTDTVGVRGDKKGGTFGSSEFGWSPTRYLTREGAGGGSYDGSNFWSGRIKLEKSKIAAGDSVEFKYLVGYDWGVQEDNNRLLIIPTGLKDTTIYWVWYNNVAPVARINSDSVVVKFRADMTLAKQVGSFSDGDTVLVEFGYFATADTVNGGNGTTNPYRTAPMVKQGLTNFYEATMTIFTIAGQMLDYQYYLHKNATDTRENFYNFDYAGTRSSERERRQVVVAAPNMTVRDSVAGDISHSRRQPYFANQRKLNQGVTVKWTVDMRPAYYQILKGDTLADIQGTQHVNHVDSIGAWGVALNGPATGGWGTWNRQLTADTASKTKMWDDGTHGDAVSGDSVYTITLVYTTNDIVGQVFKFGIGGGDNENEFGLNHLGNIDDTNPTYTFADQFGSINPKKYDAWDFNGNMPTSVEGSSGIPLVYELQQNYPNPFNPATTIVYDLPMESVVSLKVYNILGQVVATLTEGKQRAGRHVVNFDASKMTTGVYFYQISAGTFVSTKKMVLVK